MELTAMKSKGIDGNAEKGTEDKAVSSNKKDLSFSHIFPVLNREFFLSYI